jgi:hypothetical protein
MAAMFALGDEVIANPALATLAASRRRRRCG